MTAGSPGEVRSFWPYFTDSAADRNTIKQIIDGFNAEMEHDQDTWCVAAFTAELAFNAS